MKTRRMMEILVVVTLVLVIIFIANQDTTEYEYVVIPADEEFIQADFVEDEEKGLVNRFIMPEILFESEDLRISLYRLTPRTGYRATVEVLVESNLEEEFSLYVTSQVDEWETKKEFATVHEEPSYQRYCIEEVYADGIRIEENRIPNTESYDSFYFRKREYLTTSTDYVNKEVYDFNISYGEGNMEADSLRLVFQLLYTSKIELALTLEEEVHLLSNTAIEEAKEAPYVYDQVTSFVDLNKDVIEVGESQYIIEHNKLYLMNIDSEELELIYEPKKRGHYILQYYIGESCIYFLEELPAEEIDYPDQYKKYARLMVMNRDGTGVSVILDDIECDWFYLPSLYVYDDVFYMYDWDFLRAYQLDAYGYPAQVLAEEDSIYAEVSSGSLISYDVYKDTYDFYGLPFWMNRFGSRIASSESGEVIMEENEKWGTVTYFDASSNQMRGFYRDHLEAISNEHLAFRVIAEDGTTKVCIYDLVEKTMEGVLALPNGSEYCMALYADAEGVYFQKRVEDMTSKQTLYFYDFDTKSVNRSK